MKALLIALGIMAIVATAAAMSAEDEACGLNDGYAMGYMAVKGQTPCRIWKLSTIRERT